MAEPEHRRERDELRTRSVVRDLTPERQWESALRRSRERFQRFFADAPVGIALIDRSGRLQEANRALGDLFGAPLQALIGQQLISFVAEEDRSRLAAMLSVAAEGLMPPQPVDVRLTGPRGRSCVVFLSRLDGGDNGDGGLMLHFIDATEQKISKHSSLSRRRCRRSDSSPAESRMISTIC